MVTRSLIVTIPAEVIPSNFPTIEACPLCHNFPSICATPNGRQWWLKCPGVGCTEFHWHFLPASPTLAEAIDRWNDRVHSYNATAKKEQTMSTVEHTEALAGWQKANDELAKQTARTQYLERILREHNARHPVSDPGHVWFDQESASTAA